MGSTLGKTSYNSAYVSYRLVTLIASRLPKAIRELDKPEGRHWTLK